MSACVVKGKRAGNQREARKKTPAPSTIFVSGDEVRYKLASQSIPQSLSVASEKRLWLFDTARADKAPAVVAVHFSN